MTYRNLLTFWTLYALEGIVCAICSLFRRYPEILWSDSYLVRTAMRSNQFKEQEMQHISTLEEYQKVEAQVVNTMTGARKQYADALKDITPDGTTQKEVHKPDSPRQDS